MENNALCYYSGAGVPYYTPNSAGNGWVVTTGCVSYVSNVRGSIQ